MGDTLCMIVSSTVKTSFEVQIVEDVFAVFASFFVSQFQWHILKGVFLLSANGILQNSLSLTILKRC